MDLKPASAPPSCAEGLIKGSAAIMVGGSLDPVGSVPNHFPLIANSQALLLSVYCLWSLSEAQLCR